MLISEFATSINVTPAKAKKLILERLGFIPQELSDEQVATLQGNIKDATLALGSASGLSNQSEEIKQTFFAVGEKTLRKNAGLYRQLVETMVEETVRFTNDAANFIEGYTTEKISNAYQNAAKNLAAVTSEFKPFDADNLNVLTPEEFDNIRFELGLLTAEVELQEQA